MNGTRGMIELASTKLFESGLECTASYIEVYNDSAIDLLGQNRVSPRRRSSSSSNGKSTVASNKAEVLRIREHAINGPYAEGKVAVSVASVETLRTLLTAGNASRHTRQTEHIPYNSSRSHTILTLDTVLSDGQGVSLNFVDLAGTGQGDATAVFPRSPHVVVCGGPAAPAHPAATSPTRRSNFRLEAATEKKMFTTEATAISKSLATLSQVVHMLVKQSLGGGSKQFHVPFRGSALTWLLKPAFGGASKNTVIVATVSPALQHCDETLATLRWAEQSMRIVAKPRIAAVVARSVPAARPRSTPEPRSLNATDQAWTGKFPPLSASQSDPTLRRRRHSASSLQGSSMDGGRGGTSTKSIPCVLPSVRKRRNSSFDHEMETIMSSPSLSPTDRVARTTIPPGRNRGLRKEQPNKRLLAQTSNAVVSAGVSSRMQRVFGNFANHKDKRADYPDSDPELDDDIRHSPSRHHVGVRGPDINAGRPLKYRSESKRGPKPRFSRRKSKVPIMPAVDMPSVEKLFHVLPNMAKKPKLQRLTLNFAAAFKRVENESSKESTDQIRYVSPQRSPEKDSPPPPVSGGTISAAHRDAFNLERVMNRLTSTEDVKNGTSIVPTPPSGPSSQRSESRVVRPGSGVVVSDVQDATGEKVSSIRTRRRSGSSQKEEIARNHPTPPAADSPMSAARRRRSSSSQEGPPQASTSMELPRRSPSPHRRLSSSQFAEPTGSPSIVVANLDESNDAEIIRSNGRAEHIISSESQAVVTAESAVSPNVTKAKQPDRSRQGNPTNAAAPPPGKAPVGTRHDSRRKGKQQPSPVTSSVDKPSPTLAIAGESAESCPTSTRIDIDGHDVGVVVVGSDTNGDGGEAPSPNPYTEESTLELAKEASKSAAELINDGHRRGSFLSATTEMAATLFADPSTVSFVKHGVKNAGFANICVGSWFSMIVHLDLSENIVSEKACDCIAGVIKAGGWPVLATLILDGSPTQPAVSDGGAVAIVTALQTSATIKKLSLQMNQLNDCVSFPVAVLVQKTKSLRSLNLYANKLRDNGGLAVVDAMQKATTVVDLDLSDNSFSASGGLNVVQILASNPACQKIGLGWNYVGNELGDALQALIDGNRHLTHLNVQWSNLGSGTAALCKAVQKNTKLLALDISHNNLGPEGGILIAKALEQNDTLIELNLLENMFDEHSGVALGAALAVNTCLKSLNVSYNDLGRVGGEAIADALALTTLTTTENAMQAARTAAPAASRVTERPPTSLSSTGWGDAIAEALAVATLIAAETAETAAVPAVAEGPAAAAVTCRPRNTTLVSLCMTGVKSVTMASRIKLLSWSDDGALGKKHLEIDNRAKIAMARSAADNDPKVVALDLQNCQLTDADAEWLGLLLTSNTHIVELNLNRNKLGKGATAAVERALPSNKTLAKMSLQSNPFEADAISSLQRARAASQSCTLKFDAEAAEPWD